MPEHSMENMQHMSMHAGAENSLEVMDDVIITFERPKAETGKETTLTFMLTKEEKPLTDLQIMHDKLMHVVLVRKDLKHFDHIHPEQRLPGVFVAPHTFAASGDYRIWSDFTFDNMQHIVDFDLSITGTSESAETDRRGGLNIAMNSPPRIEQGKPATFTFIVANADGNAVPLTEKFLAAAGHMIAIDETLGEFEHAHDEAMDNDNKLSFAYTPQESGTHKAWVQFTLNGTTRTAGFEFPVHKI